MHVSECITTMIATPMSHKHEDIRTEERVNNYIMHDIPLPIDAKVDRTQECILCLGGTGLFCTLCGIAVAYIVWLVYAILGMTEVSDKTLTTDHCGSLLWRYVLTMIIMTLIQMRASKPNSDDDNMGATVCSLMFTYVTALGLAIWGAYEIWGRTCTDDLKQYTLYTCAYTMVVYQCVVIGLLTIVVLVFCTGLFASSNESVEVKNDNKLEYSINNDNDSKKSDLIV